MPSAFLACTPSLASPIPHQPHRQSRRLRRRNRKKSIIIGIMALYITTSPHPTDAFNIIALLTPLKLVIVGLKPSPQRWYRRRRGQDEDYVEQSTRRGCLAWFPSTPKYGPNPQMQSVTKTSRGSSRPDIGSLKKPTFAYSWGRSIALPRVRADKFESGSPNNKSKGEMTTDADILALK
jgi:vacuolar protein sorting-associated protein 8